jgi:hypothetical protein
VEDDDDGHGVVAGFCPPLTLEVHGSGYQSMSMISNAKAGKLIRLCVTHHNDTCVVKNPFDEIKTSSIGFTLCSDVSLASYNI